MEGTPKYARLERERRWLVDRTACPDLSAHDHVLIEDRYIDGTRLRLRRTTDSASGEQLFKLTKKYETGDPLARPIVTAYLSAGEHRVFESLPATRIEKRRYHLVDGERRFSLDRFCGALEGLELVEIEWGDDQGLRALTPPLWASIEVSNDPRYQGGALASLGIPKD